MSKLGRGLSALISEKNLTSEPKIEIENISRDNLSVDKVKPGKFQPRSYFDQEELAELSDSVKKNGIVQPILVRPAGDDYEIIAGERRWRAAKMAGLRSLPAIIMEVDDRKALEIALIENVQRQNLKILEEADGYQRLIDEFGYTQDQLAEVLGKSRSKITNTIRMNMLPDGVKKILNEGKISAGHARALLGAKDAAVLADLIVKKDLSVRQTESLIKKYAKIPHSQKRKAANSSSNSEMAKLEMELSRNLGLNLKINDKGGKGQVILSYSSLEELDGILLRLENPPAKIKQKKSA